MPEYEVTPEGGRMIEMIARERTVHSGDVVLLPADQLKIELLRIHEYNGKTFATFLIMFLSEGSQIAFFPSTPTLVPGDTLSYRDLKIQVPIAVTVTKGATDGPQGSKED